MSDIQDTNKTLIEILKKDRKVKELSKIFEGYSISEAEDLFEMAMNLRQDDTQLPMIIWISTKESSGINIPHGPRIKVMSTHDQKVKNSLMYSISILPPYTIYNKFKLNIDPKDFKIITKWIKRHKDTLIKYWNDEIGTRQFLDDIKSR